jgi:hypothetical protein
MANVTVLNTDASITAKTVMTNEASETITGVKTFDLDPSAPFAVSSGSAVVANLDADKVDGFDLVGWTSFTPTWTGLTIGNAVVIAKYAKVGNITKFRIDVACGTTTSVGGAVSVSFPVTAATGSSFTVAHGEVIDISTGDAFTLHARLSSSSAMALFADNGTKLVAINTTVPFTWTTSDELHILGTFESA